MSPLPNWFTRKSKDSSDSEATGGAADAATVATAPASAGGTATDAAAAPSAPPVEKTAAQLELEAKVLEALRTVFDPEIPVNIYELGLIYGIDVSPENAVIVRMTLTAPNCPAAESMPAEIRQKTGAIEGVTAATVDITFEPPWDPSRMSEAAKLELGMF